MTSLHIYLFNSVLHNCSSHLFYIVYCLSTDLFICALLGFQLPSDSLNYSLRDTHTSLSVCCHYVTCISFLSFMMFFFLCLFVSGVTCVHSQEAPYPLPGGKSAGGHLGRKAVAACHHILQPGPDGGGAGRVFERWRWWCHY